MDTFWGLIRHNIAAGNMTHIVWLGAIIVTMLILAVLHHRWRFYDQKLKKWQELCAIPLLITIIHYCIYVRDSDFLKPYTSMYLIAVIALVLAMCGRDRKGYRIAAPIVGVMTAFLGVWCCIMMPGITRNFSGKSYTESFHALAQEMDRSYVLKEWKEVDFSALEAKYMPMVKEAEQDKDPGKFADAVEMFCYELHDGHISVHCNFDTDKYESVFGMHEYGLAMIELDNGEVIAVCTDDEVQKLGIDDGTVITRWNGKPVLQAAAEDVPDHGESVKANADRVAALYLSTVGGDTVEVSFLDENGKEQTVTLHDMGENHTFCEAYDAFTQIQKTDQPNFSTKMLSDKCGYLTLNVQSTGNGLRDIFSEFSSGSCKWAKDMFRKKLNDLKKQGMECLVIDLRCNMGGCDAPTTALCELLTDDKWYAQGLGIRKNGEYISTADYYISGTGEFADLKIVALTNLECISGGDAASLYLSRLPNVTLAGITDPNGSGQYTGGCCVLSDKLVGVTYPTGLTLDENGEPKIDPRGDRVSRNAVEVRIPLDYDAAMKIFCDGQDYELDWAVQYLSR
ncbi:S41 family peptidase [Ruminococcus flavefaciens]|uniref:C-terminal processing protease CtpA/Prc, contains a PDZ domain n=1 Tax=Ruminococcus flavefaciens TaxID=1265 RepID=A0A1M7KAC9_RUMFL|nr:S41 family peptidase [Ruminococcus flavefaciens]SHM62230.1 C-terminal processing protease CtpA/Prc, contains a PDZ domain [Ruminococcus flavefaciens]